MFIYPARAAESCATTTLIHRAGPRRGAQNSFKTPGLAHLLLARAVSSWGDTQFTGLIPRRLRDTPHTKKVREGREARVLAVTSHVTSSRPLRGARNGWQ